MAILITPYRFFILMRHTKKCKMKKLSASNLKDTVTNITDYLGNPADLKVLKPLHSQPESAVIYLDGLVNEAKLTEQIDIFFKRGDRLLPANWVTAEARRLDIELENLAKGFAILLVWKDDQYDIFKLSVPGWQLRPIEEPPSEQLIRGPREGFTETISVNTAMIRRWINDPNLRVDELQVGVRTKTVIRLLYLTDVADPDLVKEAKNRISAIKIDGILESGYLEQLITDNRLTIFPLIQSTERSDKVAAAILEGRVGVLTDKSPFALIIPTTVNELYQSPEDYYFGYYLGSFLRALRMLGNNIAVALSGLYIASASNNPALLPTSFAFSIAESRRGIPYPIFVEVLLLEIMVEVFREAGLRLPKNVNQTLGVVAGVALAFAAVQAHLVSGASLVVVMISAIASFSTPCFSVGIPWRIFKFILILGATFMGIVGLTLAGILILAHAATLTSFGTSYLAPWAPIRPYELQDSFFRIPLWRRIFRPQSYRAKDLKRMSDHQNEEKRS
jgi:hypothetical protein